jgi:hypothetical protein
MPSATPIRQLEVPVRDLAYSLRALITSILKAVDVEGFLILASVAFARTPRQTPGAWAIGVLATAVEERSRFATTNVKGSAARSFLRDHMFTAPNSARENPGGYPRSGFDGGGRGG